MSGVELIAAERRRQVEDEGWSPDHDDTHTEAELARAAACYAAPPDRRPMRDARDGPRHADGRVASFVATARPLVPLNWPWFWKWWKPTPHDRIRELVKAGALIAAEIDRLQRAAAEPSTERQGES